MKYIIEMKNVSKQFNGNFVLKNIDFKVTTGEVHAIIGENGAGKSTLMKILAGAVKADTGEILINGENVCNPNEKLMKTFGLEMIYQDISLFPDLNVAENIFIGRRPIKNLSFIKIIDWKKIFYETQYYLDSFDLKIHPKTLVKTLSIGQQKVIEIIKVVSKNATIIVMDEPTSALTEQEKENLFKMILEFKKINITTIFISHNLDEIKRIADSITILRDGEIVEICRIDEVNTNHLIKQMAGKSVKDRYPKLNVSIGKEVLSIRNLGYKKRINDINFTLKKGEIIGITGLSGAGRRTLAKTLFGIYKPTEGSIYINQKPVTIRSSKDAIASSISYITSNVNSEGLIDKMSISNNISITNLSRITRFGFINKKDEANSTGRLIKKLGIKQSGCDNVADLSGGNKKKVILAKWLYVNSKIIIFDEPTSGMDISSKVDIYNIMNEILRSGASIILISSDLPELIGMCDKIEIMCNGEIKKELKRNEFSQEKILFYASGGEDNDHKQTLGDIFTVGDNL
ncbi:sugar ABC transporter ATP-binding protein [Clostridium grantii]|uniref:Ribose transport system ATP-binding protein n=1 Tax=Clostridium grantii DSM 8605 TaxID=1121316 RepID=A0A1M5SW56_9CLOT|nr:sugar ABC transporter ATP-binding protein [Clostridium grantii]SHH42736.1 ribose transport system ATP-binding protein [Clostridium grantii DSM 8605]